MNARGRQIRPHSDIFFYAGLYWVCALLQRDRDETDLSFAYICGDERGRRLSVARHM